MRLELFDYDLPPERIAQTPLEPRDASRLLYVPAAGPRQHLRFLDLPGLLQPGDVLVFNDTRVLPARLFGRKLGRADGEGARVEVLLLHRLVNDRWEALAHPGRRLQPGTRIAFGDGELRAEVVDRGAEGTRILDFTLAGGSDTVDDWIHRLGQMPLPPYIHERLDDPERYQTLYAREEGSAAAPTAGLHFTPRVFEALQERGVKTASLTLHVGLATFRPVKTETIEAHEMHEEWYTVPEATAEAIAECQGRVVAVGTTTLRCLESAAGEGGIQVSRYSGIQEDTPTHRHPLRGYPAHTSTHPSTPAPTHPRTRTVQSGAARTRLYITPGYRFRVVDALVTNFHMPRSSLLILVSAFAGYDTIREAYGDALESGYRFLSFGDAMLVERRDWAGPDPAEQV